MTAKNTSHRGRPIRLISVGLLSALITLGGYAMVQSQDAASSAESAASSSGDAVTVAETGTVSTGTLTLTLDAAGSLTPKNQETLSFGASATVTEILVQVGDTVHAGDVLARLDTTAADERIHLAELQLQQAQISLDALNSPPTQIEIDIAEANVTLAQAQLYSASSNGTSSANDIEIARLQAELARNQLWQTQINRDLRVAQEAARGDVTWVEQQEFDSSVNTAEDSVTLADMNYESTANSTASTSSLVSANASVANAQAQLDSLLAGATEDQIRQAEIQVEQAQLSLESAQETLENYVLIAPFDGVIAEQSLIVGVLPPSTGAITLVDTSAYTIDLSIAEADVVNVHEGQDVTIDVQAFSDAEITGSITHLDTSPTQDSQLVSYAATVTLNPTDDALLRPSMSATATVILKQLDDVVLIPNRFISTDSATGENVVTIESAPGVYTNVPITIGERSTSESQILTGLAAGQTIVILARESDTTTTQTTTGLGGLLGGGGGPQGDFQPPSGNFQPPSGSGGGGPMGGG
ncbi:MAG: HlyD family efflux transporter periplasmic adaptor subunit [Anaerolineae bacterium]